MIREGSAKNRSEYFETALKFYNDYQKGKEYGEIFGQTLMKVFQSTMNSFGNRMARQMFKQSVEISKLFWLMVKKMEINPELVDVLHERCTEEENQRSNSVSVQRKG